MTSDTGIHLGSSRRLAELKRLSFTFVDRYFAARYFNAEWC